MTSITNNDDNTPIDNDEGVGAVIYQRKSNMNQSEDFEEEVVSGYDGDDDTDDDYLEGDDDGDDDSEEGDRGPCGGPSFDKFIRIMGDAARYAAAYEEEIPAYLNRKQRNRYLGNIIHAKIRKTQELRSSLGVVYMQRLGRLDFTAGHTAFIFSRNHLLGGNATTIQRRLTEINGTERTFRLSKLWVIYHPYRFSVIVGDRYLTMHSTVMELLGIMTTVHGLSPLLPENATKFSVELQGQPPIAVKRLQDVHLYQIIHDIANIQRGRLWLRIKKI